MIILGKHIGMHRVILKPQLSAVARDIQSAAFERSEILASVLFCKIVT